MEVVVTRDELHKQRHALAVKHHHKEMERPLIGLVPTMGALHRGHRALIERMCAECDVSVVSIFVNPKQFGQGEDLDVYPRTLDSDLSICRAAGAHIVFAPADEEVYPPGYSTTVSVDGMTARWCGQSRPGHFNGVTTVVAKLLGACRPDRVYFGEKDFQQLQVVKRMVRDLDIGIDIVACPTVREEDGLAMSSRNQYLSPSERRIAPRLYAALKRMAACYSGGVQDVESLIVEAKQVLYPSGDDTIKVEYLAIVEPEALTPRERAQHGDRALIAAKLGTTRLIDNIALTGGEVG